MIDREIELLRSANQLEGVIFQDDAFVRRLNINRIRSRRGSFRQLDDQHRRHFAEQLCQSAGVMRIKMLHDHKRHPRSRRQMAHQFHCRFESASRAANADDRAEQIDLARANFGTAALFLLRLRGRTLTFHKRCHFPDNELRACEDSSCDSFVKGGAVASKRDELPDPVGFVKELVRLFVHFRKVPEPTEGMRHEMVRMTDSILILETAGTT